MRAGRSHPRHLVTPSPHPALSPFIAAVRGAVTVSPDPAETARRVAAALRRDPPPARSPGPLERAALLRPTPTR